MTRIGRNDPCPCGSGKKYKKCPCGALEATQFRQSKAANIALQELRAKQAAMTPQERARSRERLLSIIGVMVGLGAKL